MIPRKLAKVLRKVAGQYPVVTVTGPRQSGKTTICRSVFPRKAYVSLEPLDVRRFAREDPRGFLTEYSTGAVIDEVQHVPELLSYLQVEVDERPRTGRFVLTGSQHFGLSHAISQSLAGRTGVLHLLPLDLDEVRRFPEPPEGLWEILWTGGYPRIHDQRVPADRWLADYVTTYVQRDARSIMNVADLEAFTTFIRLCAGRTAQVLNLSALGADCGISHNTARAWLSVLETSFLVLRVPAWHRNLKKQLTRSPKLHFFDSGLLCHLLGIRTPEQLVHHPLRGPIFESWVVSEVYKARAHAGIAPDLRYFRDRKGLEVDLVIESAEAVLMAEAKSGATVASDFFGPIERLQSLLARSRDPRRVEARVVFGGSDRQTRRSIRVVPWDRVQDQDWANP